ncbi:MAG: mannitol dehydrogenase family protein, partial [Gammaproteobacteria bacterium]
GGDWGICAANIRSNALLVEQLERQNHRYHIVEFADRDTATVTEIRAIREALFAGTDPQPLLARMSETSTRIVSLTITEKGYCLNPATGELLHGDAGVTHDLKQPQAPRTAPGIVLEALRRRRALGLRPFTVLSCDNMPDNGARTRRAVVALAENTAPDLARWVDAEVAFPSTMVDRIVPAVSGTMAERMEQLIGQPDPVAVGCEAFSQWVIEDLFPTGRPDWETEGVQMVADVRPFERTKLRLLNGAHSLLAYAGILAGKSTVAEAIADTRLLALVDAFLDEASASLTPDSGIDLTRYRASVLDRFRNDALEHKLSQIASDGSQKIPQRWLDAAVDNLENGREFRATAQAVAAWMTYVRGHDRDGNRWKVDDPLHQRLGDCHRNRSSGNEIVAALLALREIFPSALAAHAGFRRCVVNSFAELTQ